MTFRALFCAFCLSFFPAWAGDKIAVVDFDQASQVVTEGAQIQKELGDLQRSRESRIKDMETQIMGMRAEYEKQQMILSEDTRRKKESEIMQATNEYQQAVVAAQQEMQQAYQTKVSALFQKMSAVCEEIGKEKGYSLILEVSQGGVVYSGSAEDITDELVKRFNAGG